MNSYSKKKKITLVFTAILVLFVSFQFTSLTDAGSGINCSVTTDGTGVRMLGLESNTNSHAELPDEGNYGYGLYCSGPYDLSNSCSNNYDVILRLHNQTNAHVETSDSGNYSYEACISAGDSQVSCDYADSCNDLEGDYEPLASISGETNAHIAEPGAYDLQVCCTMDSTTPSVRTDSATDVYFEDGEGEAVLNGTLLSLGGEDEATVWFEWGSEEDNLNNLVGQSVTTSTGSFHHEIGGLESEETYYFRAVAENDQGVAEGNTLSFKAFESVGDIILRYNEQEKSIGISEDGKIEITS